MIHGCIIEILNQKENDWGRYKIDSIGKEILAVGVIPDASIGMTVVLEGEEKNTVYGLQFQIKSVVSTETDKYAGARRFLADGFIKGIGPAKANILVQKFGNKAIDLFETKEGREKLATAKGFSEKSIEKCLPSYNESKKFKEIVLFLNGTGTKKQINDIYEKYGEAAISVLKRNPYRLQSDIDGFGFKKTDNIAIASGIKPDSIYRITAGITYIIEEECFGCGHCYITTAELEEKLTLLLAPQPKCEDLTELVVKNALKNWEENKEKLIKKHNPSYETIEKLSQISETRGLIKNTIEVALEYAVLNGNIVLEENRIYTTKMYEIESNTARLISDMLKSKPVKEISEKEINAAIKRVEERKTKDILENAGSGAFVATEEQKKAVFTSLQSKISIISGGPGRGKTAITEMIAEAFCGKDKSQIIMLAPTGRASQRITESTGYPAMTAHRAIKSISTDGIPCGKTILCDESSMADIFLANGILKYAQNCNLIFVGDVYQIASVGPGKVLKDMIDSGLIPCTMLTKGHRNSGTIATNSDLINSGFPISKYKYDEHFVYTPVNSSNILNTMVEDYLKKVNEYGIKNVMLCTAMRKRGTSSVENLNKEIQRIFTKGHNEAKYGEKVFREGDRVIQIKNDYSFPVLRNGIVEDGIFNGERGTITKIFYSEEDNAHRLVVLFDDGSKAGYTKNSIDNLELAYATTLHKCQGSEAECMMMGYTFADYKLLMRSLFYTGETRAKKEFRMYGEEKLKYGKMLSAFDLAVKRTDDVERNTSLKQKIMQYAIA